VRIRSRGDGLIAQRVLLAVVMVSLDVHIYIEITVPFRELRVIVTRTSAPLPTASGVCSTVKHTVSMCGTASPSVSFVSGCADGLRERRTAYLILQCARLLAQLRPSTPSRRHTRGVEC
jgi:hypothetical protein